MHFRLELTPRRGPDDGRAQATLAACRALGLADLPPVVVSDLFFLDADLPRPEIEALAAAALLDPVAAELAVTTLPANDLQPRLTSHASRLTFHASRFTLHASDAHAGDCIEITFLPGVTDSVADSLLAVAHSLGFGKVRAAATGLSYRFLGPVDPATLDRLARDLLANGTVQRYVIGQEIAPPFVETHELAGDQIVVEAIPVRELGEADLLALSRARRLSLDLAEMQAIQAYFRSEGREPSDVELETLAQTWSEHCGHKTFRAVVEFRDAERERGGDAASLSIDGLLKTYIRAATEAVGKPWVRSAFVDNAGIIEFDQVFDLAFKVETHNHPSALEPFGGANTGVGGVIRDILGVSAKPIANTDVLCFGPEDLPEDKLPAGVLHPRRVAAGVVHGIEDYGNKMGIPTVNGAVHFHPGFTANPLVYCGCLGILPRGSHRSLHEAQAGDLIVAIGGRTGRDGLRGATFSSMEMDHTTGAIASTAVQIGNPIVEKQVMEVILRARDAGLYHAITDCGAGGFSSAVGEMGERVGASVQLRQAPLKYPGSQPWEIWLSEAQERMVLAVAPDRWPAFQQICRQHDVEASVLGEFDGSGRLRVCYGERVVADLDMHFLHNGIPRRRLTATWTPPELSDPDFAASPPHLLASAHPGNPPIPPLAALTSLPASPPASSSLLHLLAHPNIRSRAPIIHRYDHEVQGGTVVKPLVGIDQGGPSDAAVIIPQPVLTVNSQQSTSNGERPLGSPQFAIRHPQSAIALSTGINPRYGLIDPYAMAWACVDEAFRNAVAVGADPDRIALLDNFCWGNPNLPDRLGGLVRCAQGCYDAAIAYQTPFISGKDSLNNEYLGEDGQKHAIPGALLISALGIVADATRTVTSDLKAPGNHLYLVGETRPELGGSTYLDLLGETGASVPQPYPHPLDRLRALHGAIAAGLVRACHDLSEGGLAVALAEMCIGGRLGAEIDLALLPAPSPLSTLHSLFSESLGRFLLEVEPAHAAAFEAMLAGQPIARIGSTTSGPALIVRDASGLSCLAVPVAELARAFDHRSRP